MLRVPDRFHIHLAILFATGLLAARALAGSTALAISLLLWGYCIPVACTWQMMLLGASVNHASGYRNSDTPDHSRNTWWIALLSFGDGWHNNHHAHPRSATHGHRWFELDPTYRMIVLLERLRLAHSVAKPPAWNPAGPETEGTS